MHQAFYSKYDMCGSLHIYRSPRAETMARITPLTKTTTTAQKVAALDATLDKGCQEGSIFKTRVSLTLLLLSFLHCTKAILLSELRGQTSDLCSEPIYLSSKFSSLEGKKPKHPWIIFKAVKWWQHTKHCTKIEMTLCICDCVVLCTRILIAWAHNFMPLRMMYSNTQGVWIIF